MNAIDLEGKKAVVTGAAQGIGFAIASRMVRSGASVALVDRDDALLSQAVQGLSATAGEGQHVIGVTLDITDWSAVQQAVGQVTEGIGGLDILVNNAGIAGMNVPVVDYPIDEWQKIVDINLNGTFYCCKAFVPALIDQKYGRIVNIASIAGKEGNPNASAYSASKAAVIALTKSLGKELAGMDIAVNCVTPAAARTRIFDQMSQEHIDYMLSKIPRGRFLEVDEAANMVVWLCSAENSFTTGGVFDLSGGRATY